MQQRPGLHPSSARGETSAASRDEARRHGRTYLLTGQQHDGICSPLSGHRIVSAAVAGCCASSGRGAVAPACGEGSVGIQDSAISTGRVGSIALLRSPSGSWGRARGRHRAPVELKTSENRTVPRGTPSGTRGDQSAQRCSNPAQVADLLVDIAQLRLRATSHVRTGGAGIEAQCQQFLDLRESEPQFLRPLNEPDAADHLGREQAVAARASRRLGKEALTLVEADRLEVHSARCRQLTGGEKVRTPHLAQLYALYLSRGSSASSRNFPGARSGAASA